MMGATLASGTLRLMFGGGLEHFPGTIPAGSNIQSLVIEFVITFYLMFVISGVATDTRAVSQLLLDTSRIVVHKFRVLPLKIFASWFT